MGEKSCEGCTHRGSWSVDDYGIIWGSDIECSDCARFPRDDCFKLSPDFKPRPEVEKPEGCPAFDDYGNPILITMTGGKKP